MEVLSLENLIKFSAVILSVIAGIVSYYLSMQSKRKAQDDAINIEEENRNDDSTVAWLIIKPTLNGSSAVYPLQLGRNDVGRLPQSKYNSITLVGHRGVDQYMSRFHFTIVVLKDASDKYQYFIYDEMSTNGTTVNSENIGKKLIELFDQSVIIAGKTAIHFRQNIDPVELEEYITNI